MAKPFFVFSPITTVFDNSGILVASGAQVFTYQAGTTTKLTTYPTLADAQASTNPNANPVIADSAGRIPAIWATQACKVVCAPSNDIDPPSNPYWTRDNLTSLGQIVTTMTKTANYTLVNSDRDKLIECDASGGPFTINLLAASAGGDGYNIKIKKIDSSANAITITPNGTDTIDGSTSSRSLATQNTYISMYSDSTKWLIADATLFGNSAASYPTTAGSAGVVIRSDGANNVYSTFTIPDTYVTGDVLYASAANVLTALPKNTTATRYLSNTGASNIPAWAQIALSTGVSGQLPKANGGTGQDLSSSQIITQIVKQTFTASGTYTPTSGMKYCIIKAVGGGGGGGGSANSSGSGAGAGGGSGGYSEHLATAADIGASQTVTIGTAGAGGATGNNSGGNGGDTSVGIICVAKGGGGGGGNAGNTGATAGTGGTAGTGNIINAPGSPGKCGGGGTIATYSAGGAEGGHSILGGNAAGVIGQNNGAAATANTGGGGSGGFSTSSGGTAAGGAGGTGYVVIIEFIGV